MREVYGDCRGTPPDLQKGPNMDEDEHDHDTGTSRVEYIPTDEVSTVLNSWCGTTTVL